MKSVGYDIHSYVMDAVGIAVGRSKPKRGATALYDAIVPKVAVVRATLDQTLTELKHD